MCCSEQESLPHLVGAINISLSMAGNIYIKNMLSVGSLCVILGSFWLLELPLLELR